MPLYVRVKHRGGAVGSRMGEHVPYLTAHCIFLCHFNVVARDASMGYVPEHVFRIPKHGKNCL